MGDVTGWAKVLTLDCLHYILPNGRPTCGVKLHSLPVQPIAGPSKWRRCGSCERSITKTKKRAIQARNQ